MTAVLSYEGFERIAVNVDGGFERGGGEHLHVLTGRHGLCRPLEIVPGNIAITKNFRKQTRPNGFACVNRDNRLPPISVP